jgi:hypothetical protein
MENAERSSRGHLTFLIQSRDLNEDSKQKIAWRSQVERQQKEFLFSYQLRWVTLALGLGAWIATHLVKKKEGTQYDWDTTRESYHL